MTRSRYFLITKKILLWVSIGLIMAIGLLFILKFLSNRENNQLSFPKNTKTVEESFPYKDFGLNIMSLDIKAPVIANVSGNDKNAYFKSLEKGVAHMQGTAKPGEGGLIFIFGHSSFYPWSAGDYKQVFLNLEKIKKDDIISLWYKDTEYKYQVFETKVVEPNDLSVLRPTKTEQLTLMTCVPPGTQEKRLIVNAKPIE